MKLYDETSHRSRARLRQNVRGLDDDLRDGSDDPLRITPASAPTKRTIPYCSGRLARSRRCAKLHQQRSGASAPPRPASVMLLCIFFMNLLSASTSYVRRRPYPSIRSQSTKVGSYATSQAFWCTRTLEEHDGARFAEGPACRRPCNGIKRRLLAMPTRARRRVF